MHFTTILHILTVIAAALFAWKPKAEIGAILFVLLMIEGVTVKMSAKVDKTPVKSKIKDYFDSVWNRKRSKFQNALFYIPVFIWFFITWFIIPKLIIEQFQPYNTCHEKILESGNFLIDFMAGMACIVQFMILPLFVIMATAIILFGSGIWLLSKIENLYIKK